MQDDLAGLDPESLRQRYVEMVLLHERTLHVGRANRILGWIADIGKELVARGGMSERELLPLLNHPSAQVRRSAADDIKPFNRDLFLSVMEDLVRAGGAVGRKAGFDLESMKRREENEAKPPTPRSPPDPNWLRIVNWQKDNPPPPAMRREQFEDRVSAQFSPTRAKQVLALSRPAIGLWPQRQAASDQPLASRHGGDVWAPPGWRWPIFEEEPMYFLAQINCAELAGLIGAEPLPRDGLLTFFGDFDAISGCEGAGSVEQGAVYHWPLEGLVPTEPPLPLDASPQDRSAIPVVFRPFIDLPHWSSEIIEELGLSTEERERYDAIHDDLRRHGIPDDVALSCDFDDKLLGWPALVQQDFQSVSQTGAGCHRLLAQLPARLGPGGSLYFFVTPNDLKRRRFDRCVLEEQNT